MTTHITKTWFDGEKIVTQEIPEHEVYKSPRPWVGLTDEEIHDCFQQGHKNKAIERQLIAKAIEAKLKEKNGG
jgi:hypothetical protein